MVSYISSTPTPYILNCISALVERKNKRELDIFIITMIASVSFVIDKKFQHGLKIDKRMRRTLVHNNKYKNNGSRPHIQFQPELKFSMY